MTQEKKKSDTETKTEDGPCVCTGAHRSHEVWCISHRIGTPCSTGSHVLSCCSGISCAPSHGTCQYTATATTTHLTAIFQDNLGKMVPKCRHSELY